MSDTDLHNMLARLTALELKMVIMDERVSTHSIREQKSWDTNSVVHAQLMAKLDRSLIWQSRVKIIIGTVATIIGAVALLIYQYAPWIWEALPKHGHTH